MIYRFEDCVLDVRRRELRREGILFDIEPQVFDLLHFLIANRERVVSRDEIFKAVWRGRIVSDSVLGTRINAARASIADDGAQQRLIRTLRRNGFRFVGVVFEENDAPETVGADQAVARRQAGPSVAVIPIVGGSADREVAGFCKCLTDDLTVSLARCRSFAVIAHDRTCTDLDHAERVGREFGAAYLISCQVRGSGGKVRLLVRIVDLFSRLHVWGYGGTFDLRAGFAEQDAIGRRIASAVEPEIHAAEMASRHKKPFHALTARECVLEALSITRIRTRQNYEDANKFLTRAIALDPDCARAHSVSAYHHGLHVLWGWRPRGEAIALAVREAQTAIALSEHDPWAHFALGWALTQSRLPDEGIAEYRKAIAINPHFSSSYSCLGLALSYVGRIDTALAALDEGECLNAPEVFMGLTKSARAGVYACAEKYDDAIKAARMSVREGPGLVASQRNLVINCALAGEMPEARAALRTFLNIVPSASLDTIAGAMPYVRDSDFNRTLDAFRLMGLR